MPGTKVKKVLLPKKYRKAKIINILLPENAEGENKGNTVIKTKITAKYYYRKNIINKNYKILLSGKNFN